MGDRTPMQKIFRIGTKLVQMEHTNNMLKRQLKEFLMSTKPLTDALPARKAFIKKMTEQKMISEEQAGSMLHECQQLLDKLTSILARFNDMLKINGQAADKLYEFEGRDIPIKLEKEYQRGNISDYKYLIEIEKFYSEYEPLCNNFLFTAKELAALEKEFSELKHKADSIIN